jgi:2-hydroxychromene-2-carboxylate isomerase
MADQPVFYYDLASPEAYLAAERLAGGVAEWTPIHLGPDAFRCAEERDIHMLEVERRARQRGMQPLRWPADWPADVELAILAATYAKQIGRAVAFSLAAFRQAFAAGTDLATEDGVVIAAAACEMHPNAVLRTARTRGVRDALERATAEARAAGVTRVPALRVGDRVHLGEEGVDEAAAMAGRAS